MDVIRYRKICYLFSGMLIVASIVSFLAWGLRFGIDFTGGSLMEITFKNEPFSEDQAREKIKDLGLGDVTVQKLEDGMILRFKEVDEKKHAEIVNVLGKDTIEERRFDSVGPVIGEELTAIGITLIAIVLYVAWAFRKVSRPVGSFMYGVVTLLTLFHDIFITVGMFSVLGRFFQVEVGIPFLAVLLTVLGYSVNDTIVVFDRVRENLIKTRWQSFADLVAKSVKETFARSINTSFASLLALAAIYLLQDQSIRYFSLTLIMGVIIGTYSSIFFASPILVSIKERKI